MVDTATRPRARRRRKGGNTVHRFTSYTVVGKAGSVETMHIHGAAVMGGQRYYIVSINGLKGA